MDRAGVVDENIDPALLALHLLEQRLHLGVVGMVDAHRDALAAGGGDRLGGLVDGARQGASPAFSERPVT